MFADKLGACLWFFDIGFSCNRSILRNLDTAHGKTLQKIDLFSFVYSVYSQNHRITCFLFQKNVFLNYASVPKERMRPKGFRFDKPALRAFLAGLIFESQNKELKVAFMIFLFKLSMHYRIMGSSDCHLCEYGHHCDRA